MRKHGPPRDPAGSDASRAAERGSGGGSGAAAADVRGGGWVLAQTILMFVFVVLVFLPPFWPSSLGYLGIPLAIVGAAGFVWSARSLGTSMTPYPRPRKDGELVEKGPYRFVRHPIYVAGLLFFLGVGLTSSVPATLGALALGTLWWRKALVEEAHLAGRFPEYEDYRRRVRRF
jgi:protein-S-isoprenylcysteine O-methyltransferase Ste14